MPVLIFPSWLKVPHSEGVTGFQHRPREPLGMSWGVVHMGNPTSGAGLPHPPWDRRCKILPPNGLHHVPGAGPPLGAAEPRHHL